MEEMNIQMPYFLASDTRVDIYHNDILLGTFSSNNIAIEELIQVSGLVDMWKAVYASDYIERVNVIKAMEELMDAVRLSSIEYELLYVVRDLLTRIVNSKMPSHVAEIVATSNLAYLLKYREIKKLPKYTIDENLNKFDARELDKVI